MKKAFSIGEISELLGIPKSTLRYWDSIGLIDLPRNEENNYREYSLSTVYTISDLAYYRYLKMPLQDMKKLPKLTPEEMEDALGSLGQDLNEEINRLQLAQEYLEIRLKHIQEYKELAKNPYVQKLPNFDQVYSFPYYDKASWKVCIKNPYETVLLYDCNSKTLQTGLTVAASSACKPIWKLKEKHTRYLAFPLKVDYSEPSLSNYEIPLSFLKKRGVKVRCIIARYLFSSCEDQQYDYYAAYAELINPGIDFT